MACTGESGVTLCDCVHSCALLEALDDAMFTAIGGSEASLPEARRLWVEACAALDPELLHESRAQYLRYANDVTRQYQSDQVRHPDEMLAAIEIIELLSKWGAR